MKVVDALLLTIVTFCSCSSLFGAPLGDRVAAKYETAEGVQVLVRNGDLAGIVTGIKDSISFQIADRVAAVWVTPDSTVVMQRTLHDRDVGGCVTGWRLETGSFAIGDRVAAVWVTPDATVVMQRTKDRDVANCVTGWRRETGSFGIGDRTEAVWVTPDGTVVMKRLTRDPDVGGVTTGWRRETGSFTIGERVASVWVTSDGTVGMARSLNENVIGVGLWRKGFLSPSDIILGPTSLSPDPCEPSQYRSMKEHFLDLVKDQICKENCSDRLCRDREHCVEQSCRDFCRDNPGGTGCAAYEHRERGDRCAKELGKLGR